MQDDHLDTLIDEVAHAMTDTPPDAQLAHRVSMRIAGLDAPRERSRWMQSWVLVPAVGVCALLVAVVVVKNVARENVRDNAVRLKPDTTSARGFQPRVRGPERAALQQSRVVRGPERTALPPPAVTIAPLQLDAIDVAPMALNHIDINPIAIEEIAISAMP